jgi:cation/acetate symporter
MLDTIRSQRVNPRLGTYFGIVGSLIVSQFLLLMIMQQLGTADDVIRLAVLAGPPLVFIAIGILSATSDSREFFAAGRRVPAVCSGLVLAVAATGSTGLLAWTGAFFLNGFDAWCIGIGITAGFVVMGVGVAPYLRKSGTYSLPSFLARRFQSRLLRVTAASVFIVPMLLILCAEIQMTLWVARLLVPMQPAILTAGLAGVVAVTIMFGGMRGVGWVSTSQAITVFLAILVLTAMLGVLLTNFPASQFSYGPVLRAIGRLERAQQLPEFQAHFLAFGLAGNRLEAVTSHFASPYGAVGTVSFALTSLMLAAGIAASPWLLPRSGTAAGVYSARKASGWAVFFFGLLIVSLSALAVFMRDYLMRDLVGRSVQDLPVWFTVLRDMGLASVTATEGALAANSVTIHRDAVLYALPLVPGFPTIVLYSALAGVIAAGLAAASATVYAIASLLSEDVVGGLHWDPPPDGTRIALARLMTAGVLAIGLVFVSLIETDPLRLFFWAIGLTAASAFPVVTLSIWWKRLTPTGAFASILTGFGLAVAAILAAEFEVLPLPSQLAASVGVLPALIVAIVVSKLTPLPSREVLEQIREMRIPGGETIYDREMRLLRQRQIARRS